MKLPKTKMFFIISSIMIFQIYGFVQTLREPIQGGEKSFR